MGQCRAACADEFLNRMPDGLGTVLEQGASNLSGGQKQRLCIARALIGKAKILIFDDSTSAVDTATEKKIREALAARTLNCWRMTRFIRKFTPHR